MEPMPRTPRTPTLARLTVLPAPSAGLLAGCGAGTPVFRFEVTVDGEQREITVDRVNGEVVTNEVIG